MNSKEIRVRFAPSPTGFLHVGGLRTALFNYLFARHNGGKFILRIEDTDRSREVPGATENIIETLKNFKLDFDEGPVKQSDRLDIYKKYAEDLVVKKLAYRCYCSAERLEQLRKEADAAKVPFKYDKHCLTNPESGDKFVIRQNIPEEGSTEFSDLVHGKIQIENRTLDDGVLMKSDGYPVYNFANVIDDHEMGVTHVIRGEEFIPSTPKHILLYQAFGWNVPAFAHLPLILDKNRKKLSKRFGDVAVREYVDKGYLKEALLNFIAFLGWNPKTTQEIFSVDELATAFDLTKVNRAGAVFEVEKLDFINRRWQKKLNLGTKDPLFEKTKKLLPTNAGPKLLEAVWPLVLERIKGPSELEEKLPEFQFFFTEPAYDAELLSWKDTPKDRTKENLIKIEKFLSEQVLFSDLQPIMTKFLGEQGIGVGEALWPLRVALSGLKNSPGPFEIISAFSQAEDGKKIILNRLKNAIEKL